MFFGDFYLIVLIEDSLLPMLWFCKMVFVRRLTHMAILVAFIFSCGGQWAIFQGIAWANMIREYSQMVPLTQAVEMTFSGKYPCAICKALAEKKSSDQQKALILDKYNKKLVPPVAALSFTLASSPMIYFEAGKFLRFRTDSPLVPPPRAKLI